MAGNGCNAKDCKYYGWTYDPTGRPWTCHHPDKESECCPMPKDQEQQKKAAYPVSYAPTSIYLDPDEDV